jgi:hypothetical protein
MKAAIFPTAYTLAAGIGNPKGLLRPLGLVTAACLIASVAAIAFFVGYVRSRRTEHTATVPSGLATMAARLAHLPTGSVFVMPYMYADYVAYASGQPVVWGGHCGNLRRFEWIAPLVLRPLRELFRELGVRYVLVDCAFVGADELGLGESTRLHAVDGMELHEHPTEERPALSEADSGVPPLLASHLRTGDP